MFSHGKYNRSRKIWLYFGNSIDIISLTFDFKLFSIWRTSIHIVCCIIHCHTELLKSNVQWNKVKKKTSPSVWSICLIRIAMVYVWICCIFVSFCTFHCHSMLLTGISQISPKIFVSVFLNLLCLELLSRWTFGVITLPGKS